MYKMLVCLLLIFTVTIPAQSGKNTPKAKSHASKTKIRFRPPVATNCGWVVDSTSNSTAAVNDKAKVSADTNYSELIDYFEEMPVYPGGDDSLQKFIKNNLIYPPKAKESFIEGRVIVSLVVTKTGKIKKVKVIRGIGYGCDEEAMRVIKSMPKWKPGNSLGELMNVQVYVPVNFKLDSIQIVDTSASNRKAKPKFPGGMDAVKRYIYDHIQYPKNIGCIEGKMEVEFWINAEGVIESVFVTKKLQPYLSSEVVRVIKTLPRFIPAKQKGINVSTKIILPLKFEIK